MSVVELLEGADSYTSLAEVAATGVSFGSAPEASPSSTTVTGTTTFASTVLSVASVVTIVASIIGTFAEEC